MKKELQVELVYKSSPEASFRLFKALEMLINEKDILDYYQRFSKDRTFKPERPSKKLITAGRKDA